MAEPEAPNPNRYRGPLGSVHRMIDEVRARINNPPANVIDAQNAISGEMMRLEGIVERTNRFISGRPPMISVVDEMEYRMQLLSGQRQPAQGESVIRLEELGEEDRRQAALSVTRMGQIRAGIDREQERYVQYRQSQPSPLELTQPEGQRLEPGAPLPPITDERTVRPLPQIFSLPDIAPPSSGGNHPPIDWWGPVDCGSCHSPSAPMRTPPVSPQDPSGMLWVPQRGLVPSR